MVIDFHTHIFKDSLAPKAKSALEGKLHFQIKACTDMTLSSLLERMDEWGVDMSVVQPVVTKPSQTLKVNDWAASICSDRVTAFGGMHPATDDYKRDIDYIASLGLKGIKLHAEYQDFWVDEPRMLKIYDYAFEKGLIILHHGGEDPGMPPPYKTTPDRVAHVLDEMKGGVMIIAHLGGYGYLDDVERYLVGRDVYLDTSMGFEYYPRDRFLGIVKNHGADKILFGSDSPWSNAGKELETLEGLDLTAEEKKLIKGENAKRLLKI